MDYSLKVQKEIKINAHSSTIWKALTSNEKLSDCFKMSVNCDSWKRDEIIYFSGFKNNTEFIDKAIIKEFQPNKLLTYNYYKSNSNNFTELSFGINQIGNNISELILNGKGFLSINDRTHAENAWSDMLKTLKIEIEENAAQQRST